MTPFRVILAVWRGDVVDDPADAALAAEHASVVQRRWRSRRIGRDSAFAVAVAVPLAWLSGHDLFGRVGLLLVAIAAVAATELALHAFGLRRLRAAARAEQLNIALLLHTIAARHARPRSVRAERRPLRLVA